MGPVTIAATALTIAKSVGELSKKVYELSKSLKDRESQHQVDEILDQMRELKQSASELEDQNRDLREKLRFKSDDFEFRTPLWYDKAHPERALCPKCLAKRISAPMGEPGHECAAEYRRCLVCGDCVLVGQRLHRGSPIMASDYPRRR